MSYEVIQKFFRQVVTDPARQVLIKKHFDLNSTTLLLLMFHQEEIYKTAVALETESLRKIDMNYENKVKIMDKDSDTNLVETVMKKEEE